MADHRGHAEKPFGILTRTFDKHEHKAVNSTRQAPLPQFRLETDSERGSLRRLKLNWGGRKQQQAFKVLVLAHLGLIETTVKLAGRAREAKVVPKCSEEVRTLTRRAVTVRKFVDWLNKPFASRWVLLLHFPPTSELLAYAVALETAAANMRTVPKDEPSIAIRLGPIRARRRPRPETKDVLNVIRFVKQQTGAPHWNDLAVLLRRPLADTGVCGDRLRALERAYRPKPRTGHHAHFPSGRRMGIVPSYAEMLTSSKTSVPH